MRRAAVVLVSTLLAACGRESSSPPQSPSGDAVRGKIAVEKFACTACHHIPGFDRGGALGPSLAGIGARPLISGRVPNNEKTMTAYIVNPPAIDPPTRMPPLGVPEEEARDISAYLSTLK